MKTISSKKWKTLKDHKYTSVIDGQKYILEFSYKRGTCLIPVRVVKVVKVNPLRPVFKLGEVAIGNYKLRR